MDKQHFDQLVNGVKEMKRHIAGKTVPGAISTELPVPDVRLIREAAHISQSQFAKLIGVNLRTLQNWSNIAPVLPGQPGRCSKSWHPTPKPLRRCTRDYRDRV